MRFTTKLLRAALAEALTPQIFLHVVKVYWENVAFAMGKDGQFYPALLAGGMESRDPGTVWAGRELEAHPVSPPCHRPGFGHRGFATEMPLKVSPMTEWVKFLIYGHFSSVRAAREGLPRIYTAPSVVNSVAINEGKNSTTSGVSLPRFVCWREMGL